MTFWRCSIPLFLVFLGLPASRADVVLYNGTGSAGELNGSAVGWFDSSQFSQAQSFTNTYEGATITSISAWLQQGSSTMTGSFNLKLFASTGTPGTTATPTGLASFSTTYNTSYLSSLTPPSGSAATAQQISFTGLNWSVNANTNYFFAFDATNMTGSSSSANYFLLQRSSPDVSGQNEAYSTNSLSTWTSTVIGLNPPLNYPTAAATVYASVPEPGTLILLALAQGVFAAGWLVRRYRKKLAGLPTLQL